MLTGKRVQYHQLLWLLVVLFVTIEPILGEQTINNSHISVDRKITEDKSQKKPDNMAVAPGTHARDIQPTPDAIGRADKNDSINIPTNQPLTSHIVHVNNNKLKIPSLIKLIQSNDDGTKPVQTILESNKEIATGQKPSPKQEENEDSSVEDDGVLTEALPVGELLDAVHDISIIKLDDSNTKNAMKTLQLFRDAKKSNSLANMLSRTKAEGLNLQEGETKQLIESGKEKLPEIESEGTLDRSVGLILRDLSLNKLSLPNFLDESAKERTKRELETKYMTNLINSTSMQRNISRKSNNAETSVDHVMQKPQKEELKISRIGYIIFEKDEKIKEAKETKVSDLKSSNRTGRTKKRKPVQICSHGHPVGQHHDPQHSDLSHSGDNQRVETRILQQQHHSINSHSNNGLTDVHFDPSGKNFGPNSIEILAISEDLHRGLGKKDFSDLYDVDATAIPGRDHHKTSYLSAFHVLLITAVCIFTVITISYLTSRYRSGDGRPRQLNSHTALFEPHTKYDRY